MKKVFLQLFLFFLSVTAYAQVCTLGADVTSTQSFLCTGQSAMLTAAATNGTAPYSYRWSTGETTPSITVAGPGTYTVTITDATDGCQPVSRPITIRSGVIPPAPTVESRTTCPNGVVTLTATDPGGTYSWYDAPTDGNLLKTGDSYLTPPLTATTNFYVETNTGECNSPRTEVRVTVVNLLRTAGARVCSGTTADLRASGQDTYQWFDNPSASGTPVGTGPVFTTPVLNTTTSYYVVGVRNGCTSPVTEVVAEVIPSPNAPVVPFFFFVRSCAEVAV